MSWRQFQLYDFTPIRDPNYKSADALYSDSSLTAIQATNSFIAIAVQNSVLKLVNPVDFTLVTSLIAYDLDYYISFVKSIPNSNLLVTLAEKQGSPAIVKLWDLTKLAYLEVEPENLKFKFQTQVVVSSGDNSYPISCFEFNDDLTCVAIGYTNGKVVLIRGDLLRDRGSKQRLIYETNDPITGIKFHLDELLYVTTTSKILTIPTTGRNHGKPSRILSQKRGIELNCSAIQPNSHELIVATQDSITFYNNLAKTNSFNFEAPKSKIFKVKNEDSLLIVSSQDEEIATGSSKKKLVTNIIILDLRNKHISFNLKIPNNLINHVFELSDDIFLLSNDGILYKLHEKPINQQIEVVLQRELFPIAYNIAKQAKLSKKVLLRIQKLYGEFLYGKQKFEESIKVFNKCLDLFDSHELDDEDEDWDDFIMNIITKFREVSNISNLTKFLYKLYELKKADNDHITLLLCCYCKLKLTDELDEFINSLNLSGESADSFQDLNFQLIINLFKECGYFNQVIKLLYKLEQPNLIVGIQLNDLKKPKESLQFVKTLAIDDLLLILIDHSKTFLDFLPIETTELLINVFTGKYSSVESKRDPLKLTILIESEGTYPEEKEQESTFPLNNYKSFLAYISRLKDDDTESTVSGNSISEPTYLPPRPNIIYPSFINHRYEFVIFLEACVETFEKYQGNEFDKKDILITLLEMYLSLDQTTEVGNDEWRKKARQLVEDNSSLLDNASLLLLSHIYDFQEGEVISKEKSGYEESLFQSYEIAGDVAGCFGIIKKFASRKPILYKMMLKFIVSKREIFDQISIDDFKTVLNEIDRIKLMSPLEVLQVLTSAQENDYVTLGLVKDYLIDYIDNQSKEVNNNNKLINYYETESTKNSYKLTELTTKPFIIQNNKCAQCSQKLDFPVIHFRCGHSYHQKCLSDSLVVSSSNNDGAPQCPQCINEVDEIKTIRNAQFKSKDNIEYFESALDESKDRFRYISEYLGKGVMENESVTLMKEE